MDQCISSLQVTFGPLTDKILSFCNTNTIDSIKIIFQNLSKANYLKDFPALLNSDNETSVYHSSIYISVISQSCIS